VPSVTSKSCIVPLSLAMLLFVMTHSSDVAAQNHLDRPCAELERLLMYPATPPDVEMRSAMPREALEDIRARVVAQPNLEQRAILRRYYLQFECGTFQPDADA